MKHHLFCRLLVSTSLKASHLKEQTQITAQNGCAQHTTGHPTKVTPYHRCLTLSHLDSRSQSLRVSGLPLPGWYISPSSHTHGTSASRFLPHPHLSGPQCLHHCCPQQDLVCDASQYISHTLTLNRGPGSQLSDLKSKLVVKSSISFRSQWAQTPAVKLTWLTSYT